MSNEDLSPTGSPLTEKQTNGIGENDDDFEPCEWRRISKLRRSLQLPSSRSSSSSSIRNAYKFGSRPLDLPENLVSVSKIREELENGNRLDRAMRNNHVDLVALNNILKGVPESGACKCLKFLCFNASSSVNRKKRRNTADCFIALLYECYYQHPVNLYIYSQAKLAVK